MILQWQVCTRVHQTSQQYYVVPTNKVTYYEDTYDDFEERTLEYYASWNEVMKKNTQDFTA